MPCQCAHFQSLVSDVLLYCFSAQSAMSCSVMEAPGDVSSLGSSSRAPDKPLCKVGLVSDIQYGDIDSRNIVAGRIRNYRNSIAQLKQAVLYWNEENVDFVLHCGDVIDGANSNNGTAEEAIDAVADVLTGIRAPVHHILGNHCVYCFNRKQLRTVLKMQTPCSEVGYYSISPCPSWKFLMLDSSDVALFGRPADHPNTQLARLILDTENHNENKFSRDGMVGVSKRFVGNGGAISCAQKAWIQSELLQAREKNENVVVSCHIPLMDEVCSNTSLLWNYEEIRELLQEFSNVKLALYGHTHLMSYMRDATGIHHLVLPGLVEAVPGTMGYGSLEIHNERMEVIGFNRDTLVLPL